MKQHYVTIIDYVRKIILSFILPLLCTKPSPIPMILKRIYMLQGIPLSYSIKNLCCYNASEQHLKKKI